MTKTTKPTLELEKIGKNRKREVINNERTKDWKQQIAEYIKREQR
jgi:hypothetical protein